MSNFFDKVFGGSTSLASANTNQTSANKNLPAGNYVWDNTTTVPITGPGVTAVPITGPGVAYPFDTSPWGTSTTSMPWVNSLHCPLPEDVLEKLLAMGIGNNKELLKAKLVEAYRKWCNTQMIDTTTIPVILIASLIALGVDMSNLPPEPEPKVETKEKEE